MTKEELIYLINSSGCRMLKKQLDGTETKDEIVEYLISCRCPIIKSHL